MTRRLSFLAIYSFYGQFMKVYKRNTFSSVKMVYKKGKRFDIGEQSPCENLCRATSSSPLVNAKGRCGMRRGQEKHKLKTAYDSSPNHILMEEKLTRRTLVESWKIRTYDLRTSKWKAGVRSLLIRNHLSPFEATSPSPETTKNTVFILCLARFNDASFK